MREQLIAMIAHLEVTIGYQGRILRDVTSQEVHDDYSLFFEAMDDTYPQQIRSLIRDGITTVIVGRQMQGKSEALWTPLARNRAIVTGYSWYGAG